MIWPFLFALLFVIFAWKSIYNSDISFLDYCVSTLLFAIATFFAAGVGFVFSLLIGLAMPKHWTGPETVRLVSLRGSDGISGRFVLGTGSIGTTEYYFFYEESGRGYKPGKIAVQNNVTVFEEKDQKGELKVYTYQFTNPIFKWVAMCFEAKKYEFLIPEGSLKKNFVLQ